MRQLCLGLGQRPSLASALPNATIRLNHQVTQQVTSVLNSLSLSLFREVDSLLTASWNGERVAVRTRCASLERQGQCHTATQMSNFGIRN